MFRFTIRDVLWLTVVVALGEAGMTARADTPPTRERQPVAADSASKYTAPVIEFDRLVEEDGRRIARFRLTNPTDRIARYAGPKQSSPSVVFYTPDDLTRKRVNFFEHWSWCGNCNRIQSFELQPGQFVECQVIVPSEPTRFRLSTELVSEPNYTPLIEAK